MDPKVPLVGQELERGWGDEAGCPSWSHKASGTLDAQAGCRGPLLTHSAVCAHTSVYRPRATATHGQPQCHHHLRCRDTPARTRVRMRRNPGTYHRMKMASATTRTRRPPRTGATSAHPSGRAAPPAPLPPGASAGRWTRRPPAHSAPPANPLAPPAPWARNATKFPTPHYPFLRPPPPTLPPLSREWMWNGTVQKLHSRSSTLCGVHSPTSSAIHSSPSSPALGIPNTPVSTTLCLSCALESPRAVPEARDLPLPCRGARGFQKPALLPFMLGLLETRVLTNSTAYRVCHVQAWPGRHGALETTWRP